jgi:hypothetical protein
MSIRTQYNEFRQNLNEEIKEMVKAIYVKTYGCKPNFEDDETYSLCVDDIPCKGKGTLSVDVYVSHINDNVGNQVESQEVQYLNITNEDLLEVEANNPICINTLGTDEVMKIYEYLDRVADKMNINTEPRTAYVEWDISDSEYETFVGENIPTEVEIPFYVTDEEVEDYLSDKYGYCVESYTIDNE